MNPIVLLGLNQWSRWQGARGSDQLGQPRAHVRPADPRSEQTHMLKRTLTHTHTHTPIYAHLILLCSLGSLSVHRVSDGPWVPMEVQHCNTALYGVLLCLRFTSLKNIKCQVADYNVPFNKKKTPQHMKSPQTQHSTAPGCKSHGFFSISFQKNNIRNQRKLTFKCQNIPKWHWITWKTNSTSLGSCDDYSNFIQTNYSISCQAVPKTSPQCLQTSQPNVWAAAASQHHIFVFSFHVIASVTKLIKRCLARAQVSFALPTLPTQPWPTLDWTCYKSLLKLINRPGVSGICAQIISQLHKRLSSHPLLGLIFMLHLRGGHTSVAFFKNFFIVATVQINRCCLGAK